MPRVAKRKAVELAADTTPAITTFGRVSKTNTLNTTPVKKHAVDTDAPSKKRKTTCTVDEIDITLPSEAAKRPCRRVQEPAPEKKVVKGKRVAKAPAARQTAHKASEDTLISKTKQANRKVQTKLDASFKKVQKKQDEFPPHLAELIAINRAFVKTTLLHMVHAGSTVPVDVRTLTPSITAAFTKRGVTIEDIRRCVAIQSSEKNGSSSPFMITDYGRGKVCIELVRGQDISSVKEEKLCKQFEQNLKLLAEEKNDDAMEVDIPLDGLSLGDLPQVDITDRNIGLSANPLLKKGHQALTSLQNSVAEKHQEKATKAQASPILNADGTKMSLLDRLRHKQLLAANSAPCALTGPEAERRAALNRVPDVSATLAMLCLSKPASLPRQAFTMGTVLEKLKDSLRVPISREEAMASVRLIAGEVAPEWAKVLCIGGRENVVLSRGMQPGEKVIQERVEKLLG